MSAIHVLNQVDVGTRKVTVKDQLLMADLYMDRAVMASPQTQERTKETVPGAHEAYTVFATEAGTYHHPEVFVVQFVESLIAMNLVAVDIVEFVLGATSEGQVGEFLYVVLDPPRKERMERRHCQWLH